MPFAPRICFVDVETTGSSPASARVTEVGVVTVVQAGDSLVVEEWSSLVNPGMAIPPEIQYLTGITPAMVADAPRFAALAGDLNERLRDAVFVAHHARFDYGFLKQEFARAGIEFAAKTLCTVRLSKLLDPDRAPHSLDAVILRHELPVTDRHRALGDAKVLWEFIQALYRKRGADTVEPAIKLLLKQPSLPAHLPAGMLNEMPKAPGVYLFYGVNEHPLYIGKSTNLRERVGSHFVMDYRSERGVRLASETRRIEWQETAGDLGARLLEQQLIHERLPAHNIALRRKRNQFLLEIVAIDATGESKSPRGPLKITRLADRKPADLAGRYGPFGSRASIRRRIIELAPAEGLCLKVLRLERGEPGAPCFNRQISRCRGACVGAEPVAATIARLVTALQPLLIEPWPFAGAVVSVERDPQRFAEDWHVFDQWCYLGTVRNEQAAIELATRAEREFDPDTYKLIRAAIADSVVAVDAVSAVNAADRPLPAAPARCAPARMPPPPARPAAETLPAPLSR